MSTINFLFEKPPVAINFMKYACLKYTGLSEASYIHDNFD